MTSLHKFPSRKHHQPTTTHDSCFCLLDASSLCVIIFIQTLCMTYCCVMSQVKAVTHFMAEGPWSDAFCLELPHFTPTTSTLPSTVESNAGIIWS